MILLHLIFFPVFVLILIFQQIFVPVSISLAIFWFLGIQYSAKPIRAKAIPFIDMLFNALYVMPGVVGYMYFSTLVEVGPHFYYAVAAGILWCMAMHAYSAVPDISADKQAGIRTTATVLGKKYTLLLCTCLYLVSTLLAASILGGYALLGGAVYIGMMLYSLIEQTNETKLFRLYTWFPYVNMIMGAGLFFWTILH
jgi:4-hydroxybenzoate polyprenyltransferase